MTTMMRMVSRTEYNFANASYPATLFSQFLFFDYCRR
jgi:hypothetical protein